MYAVWVEAINIMIRREPWTILSLYWHLKPINVVRLDDTQKMIPQPGK